MNPQSLINNHDLLQVYQRLSGKYEFIFDKSSKKGWCSNLENGIAAIYYNDSPYPESCFAHELLHLEIQDLGFRTWRNGFSHFDHTDDFLTLLFALSNEFQHHRIFPRFCSLGFPSDEFYDYEDVPLNVFLNDSLSHRAAPFTFHLLNYLTAIAPDGTMTKREKEDILRAFYRLNHGSYQNIFFEIQNIFDDWENDDEYFCEPYVKRFFKLLPRGDYTWIGYERNSSLPGSGFFVDNYFEF